MTSSHLNIVRYTNKLPGRRRGRSSRRKRSSGGGGSRWRARLPSGAAQLPDSRLHRSRPQPLHRWPLRERAASRLLQTCGPRAPRGARPSRAARQTRTAPPDPPPAARTAPPIQTATKVLVLSSQSMRRTTKQ